MSSPAELESLREQLCRPREGKRVTVCGGTGCHATGCREIAEAVNQQVERQGLSATVDVLLTGCHGFCEQGPIIVVRPDDVFYPRVKKADVAQIVAKTVALGEAIPRLLYVDPSTGERLVHEAEIPFYKNQVRRISGQSGMIAPVELADYLRIGGYRALVHALFSMQTEQIIQEISDSGLRGRGGGGFPTGWKWESCRDAPGERKFVICNGDEGDPGAFMDCALLEGNPHAVIEGMLIGALAIGAAEGFVYVRHEYPRAVERVAAALTQAREAGLIGPLILGSDFCFELRISRGGGAFVCGESTALMASLEGRVGEPRAKYVHTVEHGLHDLPSTLNNVETWANIPWIINQGAAAFAAIGTEHSKGTKIFSLVGKIQNTGLVEVPMGTTLREVIYEIGGGLRGGRSFKAVQTGGPSGGCLPESLLDLEIDFQKLTEAGSMMGSGGMIVMDDQTCMVDVARYFMRFLLKESCGKCAPCREGLNNACEILDRVVAGAGRAADLDLLEGIGEWMTTASLCALGGSAANPVLSTLRYFREEYEAHIHEQRCPGGICRALITYAIDQEACNGCHACVKVCPADVISGEREETHWLDSSACIKCGACFSVCPEDAILRS